MGKKSREKRAKQLERDRKKLSEEGGPSTSSPGASTSRVAEHEQEEVPPDHHDTPAAAGTPSADDTHDDEPASTAVNAPDSTAAVAEKLLAFCHSCDERQYEDIKTWVDGEFSGDIAAVKAAAERGDAKAQYAVGFMMTFGAIPGSGDDGINWLLKAADQGYADAILAVGVSLAGVIVRGNCPQGREEAFHNEAKHWLTKSAVEHHSADAQYLIGMLDCFLHGCARSEPDMLTTARWFRMVAHQRLAEAQWELGEWFRRGLFCDVHVPFARQYIRRAARQGHAAAIERLNALCSCVHCGAAAAPLKCSTCLATMYCDSTCSKKHWRRGGGVSEVCEAALPHKKTCPRTFDDPCA
jgi:TPR repeat protein